MKLSIVLGTYERFPLLTRFLESVRFSVKDIEYEIVAVDGGSRDETVPYLRKQKDVVLIEQRKLLGAVRAYNEGFARAEGVYVAHLNDDCEMQDDALWECCALLDDDPMVGQVAIPHWGVGSPQPVVTTTTTGTPRRRWLMAAFGVTRRRLGVKAGWWDGYYHFCGDNHLSMSVWKSGHSVLALHDHYLTHAAAPNRYRGSLEVRWQGDGITHKSSHDFALYEERWGGWNGEPDA